MYQTISLLRNHKQPTRVVAAITTPTAHFANRFQFMTVTSSRARGRNRTRNHLFTKQELYH